MELKLLNLGCGSTINPLWVNVDLHPKGPGVIAHDLTKGAPFPDNTFDAVYHSAVLEHFAPTDGEAFLRECFRVLKPGGVLRVAVPDLEGIARAYIHACDDLEKSAPHAKENQQWMVLEMIDQLVRNKSGGEMGAYLMKPTLPNQDFVYERIGEEGRNFRERSLEKQKNSRTQKKSPIDHLRGFIKNLIPKRYFAIWKIGSFRLSGEVHQWMYDQHTLATLLSRVGFIETTKQQPTTSRLPTWKSYNLDTLANGTVIKPDSLYMEAMKPANA